MVTLFTLKNVSHLIKLTFNTTLFNIKEFFLAMMFTRNYINTKGKEKNGSIKG